MVSRVLVIVTVIVMMQIFYKEVHVFISETLRKLSCLTFFLGVPNLVNDFRLPMTVRVLPVGI